MKYQVYASRVEEIDTGHVWIRGPQLPTRCIAKIRNLQTHKKVFCEALQIEENFLNEYNSSKRRIKIDQTGNVIVINFWYRHCLGICTKSEQELIITPCNNRMGQIRACLDHPQVVVRLATKLGIISVLLAIVAVLLGAVRVVFAVL